MPSWRLSVALTALMVLGTCSCSQGIATNASTAVLQDSRTVEPSSAPAATRPVSEHDCTAPGYPPGFQPQPVPTTTPIDPPHAKYRGWTPDEIARHYIALMEEGPYPVAHGPSSVVAAQVVKHEDAPALGLTGEDIAYQSPTDVVIVLSGDFKLALHGVDFDGTERWQHVLYVIDTYSGGTGFTAASNNVDKLLELLP